MMKKTVIIGIITSLVCGGFNNVYAEDNNTDISETLETVSDNIEESEENDVVKQEEELKDLSDVVYLEDQEDTFPAYVDHLLGAQMFSDEVELAKGKGAYNGLTANEKKFYNALLPEITKVANGQRTSSVFQITFANFGITLSERNAVWEEITNPNRKLAFFTALLYDCPYECYWIDKTTGIKISADSTKFTLSLSVVAAFEPSTSSSYTIDTSKIKSVPTAVARAKNIVEKYKNKSDLEKLKGYANEICALTEYNYTAASSSTTFGNPWNLIYVFDGNSSTKVVCEGYSKAFQYLCDLSTFTLSTTVVSVTGTCGGSHMWNMVRMYNGKNYLVDLTNCDSGSSCGFGLFMKGGSGSVSDGYKVSKSSSSTFTYKYNADTKKYLSGYLTLASSNYVECSHNWVVSATNTVATCTTKGVHTVTCSKCGAKQTTEAPALGHNYTVKTVTASCTEDGYTLHTCTRCQSSYKDNVVKAVGHQMTSWMTEPNVTCETGGTRIRHCTVCTYTETEDFTSEDHIWSDEFTVDQKETCTEDGIRSIHCTMCSAVKDVTPIPACHHYEDIVTEPTCECGGYVTHICAECQDTYVDAMTRSLGHMPVIDEAYEPTCTECGKTEGSHCAGCGEVYVAQQLIPAKGHGKLVVNTKNATCTTAGRRTYTCTDCFKVVKTEFIPILSHSYNIYGRCTRCGAYASGVSTAVPASKVSKITKAKGAFTVKWSKNTKVKGYQVRYSTKPTMASGKTVKITKNKTTSKKIKGAKKTKYYVQIRTYKTVSGKTKYSPWSAVKSVTTK